MRQNPVMHQESIKHKKCIALDNHSVLLDQFKQSHLRLENETCVSTIMDKILNVRATDKFAFCEGEIYIGLFSNSTHGRLLIITFLTQ